MEDVKGQGIVSEITLLFSKITQDNLGRVPLPCAELFGRSYHCCHDSSKRVWLRAEVKAPYRSESIDHPLCCSRGWSVAIFHLALRRAIRGFTLGRTDFKLADEQIRAALASYFPEMPPEIDSYWELARDLSAERKKMHDEKKAEIARKQATVDFIKQRRNADKKTNDSLPHYLITLGFTHRPRTSDEIKIAYRRLALEVHPDTPGGDSRRFKRIDEAYHQAIRWADREL